MAQPALKRLIHGQACEELRCRLTLLCSTCVEYGLPTERTARSSRTILIIAASPFDLDHTMTAEYVTTCWKAHWLPEHVGAHSTLGRLSIDLTRQYGLTARAWWCRVVELKITIRQPRVVVVRGRFVGHGLLLIQAVSSQ